MVVLGRCQYGVVVRVDRGITVFWRDIRSARIWAMESGSREGTGAAIILIDICGLV